MTFEELYDLSLEANLSTGTSFENSSFDALKNYAAALAEKIDWGAISWEITKLLDPTGISMYDDIGESVKSLDQKIKAWNADKTDKNALYVLVSTLVFLLCVYGALPNVGLLAGGVGGLLQYTTRLQARILRAGLTSTGIRTAEKEITLLAKATDKLIKDNPEKFTEVLEWCMKNNVMDEKVGKEIHNFYIEAPKKLTAAKPLLNVQEYLDKPEILNKVLKSLEDKLNGVLGGNKFLRHRELTRKNMSPGGLTGAERIELKSLERKASLTPEEEAMYAEAQYADMIRKASEIPAPAKIAGKQDIGPKTPYQDYADVKDISGKVKKQAPPSTLLGHAKVGSSQYTGPGSFGTKNYYGITGTRGNIIAAAPGTRLSGLTKPSQLKARAAAGLLKQWGPMNEPATGGGTSEQTPTYRPAAQQPGQTPAYNYEFEPVTISAPAPTNLPPVKAPPVKTSTGGGPTGVRFAPLQQRPVGATEEEPLGRYTPGAKDYSIPDNTSQLYKNNVPKDNSAAPMPLFQQLSVQKHNDEQDKKRASREAREETKKNIKSFKDSLRETDKDNNP